LHVLQRFLNREDAGRQLAARLDAYKNRPDVVVLGLPRGGVPVAYEVARHLAAPLDVFVVRKLGLPGQSELAMGAIAGDSVEVLNHDVIDHLGVPRAVVDRVVERERAELQRREAAFRADRLPLDVADKTVIIVDDGLATGSTMEAAIAALRQMRPARIVVAVPVGAEETCARLRGTADDVICLSTPWPFTAVGQWYEDFAQTTDQEVRALLSAR
jgi:putative phosphoribosyl transferase